MVCENKLYFARNTKVYIEPLNAAGASQGEVWEVPVLDGFSFSQATNSSEITLAEMESTGGISRRGKRMFNDSLAPAEWSMSTYVRPFMATGTRGATAEVLGEASGIAHTRAVEEVLWALLMGPALYDTASWLWEGSGTAEEYQTWDTAGTTMTLDFGQSNKATLGTANIYFQLGEGTDLLYYKLGGAVVNEATLNFDIDGIAMIEWSGMGSTLEEVGALPSPTDYIVTEGITDTDNFIRNRLTSLSVIPNKTDGPYTTAQEASLENSYDLILTGGSITFSNNITYITPEELGVVNIPIGHVTGNRSVSGSFTTYLATHDTATDKSADFWEDTKALTTVVTHDFALTFNVGGSSGDPRMTVTMPGCHVEIPSHSIEDVISLETNFTALGTCIEATDEATISYYAT